MNEESHFKLLLRIFLHVNTRTFNSLQKELLGLVLDVESGPDEIAEAIAIINRTIGLLMTSGWKPERAEGDAVNRPQHYDVFPMEPTYFLVESGGQHWCIENFVKYICRYPFKNGIEDLRKAMRNLAMYLKYLEGDPRWSL